VDILPAVLQPPPLTTTRDRDAWFTIRGFVRQVHQSILDWLRLSEAEVLELECGEDIDRIIKAIDADGTEAYYRVLGQVKQRQKSITLRSSEAPEAIAGFVEHRAQNPTLNLSFRFITNAKVGKERPSPYKDKVPALTRWEQLRQEGVGAGLPIIAADKTDWLAGIRLLLTTANRPEGLDESTWAGLKSFLEGAGATDAGLLELIRSFTWDTEGPEADAMAGEIRTALVAIGAAQTDAEAQPLYASLFVWVFTLLSRRGIKRLTSEDRDRLLTSPPPLMLEGTALLERLEERVFSMEARLVALQDRTSQVEHIVGTHAEALQAVNGQVDALARAQGIEIVALRHAAETLILDVPPSPEPLAARPQAIAQLVPHCCSIT
jgi:hypothetical protein